MAFGALAATGCARVEASRTLLDAMDQAGLRRFARLTRAAGLDSLLDASGSFTVFAPDDAAVEALGPERLDALMLDENRAELRRLVAGHILPAAYDGQALAARSGDYVTAAGTRVVISGQPGSLTVGNASVLGPDMPADNGFLFTIDRVLTAG